MRATLQIGLDDLNKDHWFNWQQPACPLLLGACLEACGTPFRKTFAIPFFTSILYFRPLQNGEQTALQGSWLLRLEEGTNTGAYLVDALQLESFRRTIAVEFETVSNSLLERSRSIKSDPGKLPADLPALARVVDSFFELFRRFYTLGAITEPIQWRVEPIVKRDLIGSRIGFAEGAAAHGWDASKILGATFVTQNEPYSLEILADLGRLSALGARLVAGHEDRIDDVGYISSILLQSSELEALMDRHVAKYSWKQANYLRGLEYDGKACLDEVIRSIRSTIVDRAKDPKSQAEEAAVTRAALLAARVELLASVSDYHRRLLLLGDEFGSGMADRRKRTMLQALAAIELLAQAMSDAAGMERADIVMLMPEEVSTFCRTPDLLRNQLRARREGFLLIESPFPILNSEFNAIAEAVSAGDATEMPTRSGSTYVELTQLAGVFEELTSNLNIVLTKGGHRVLSGDVAYSDSQKILVGRARIVRNPESDKFEPGEILVATSTTPDFMPQLRVAKAIVTDQGGMATHAALTSRELKIPCIVGTAVGTLKIRNGDSIELDLQTGHIKLLEL